ncbi:hypothetical protein [Nocardioides sp. SR21]|uniref:hypothetical protein n=1 Tax=Nocardioides sp. SR21 TaxID=2919501 RepID=UPI001FA993E8|nr:hypothetical protein [Nocardioides sp. SR21]
MKNVAGRRPVEPLLITLLLVVLAVVSLTLGVTSEGPRGLFLGLVVPALCIGCISATGGMLRAFMVAAVAWLVGIELAPRFSSDVDDDVINLWPFLVASGLVLASCLGMLCRIGIDGLRDRRTSADE